MASRSAKLLLLAGLMALSAVGPARADQYSVTVPGTANLFGAGQSTLPAPEGNGAGTVPILVTLPAGTGRILRVISTAGLVSYTPSVAASGAAGVTYSAYTNCDWSGLSGYRLFGIRVLSGVVLSDSTPVAPAPAKLLVDSLGFRSLSPGLRQIFPIGDGLMGTGLVWR
jgi:hypothetical protein